MTNSQRIAHGMSPLLTAREQNRLDNYIFPAIGEFMNAEGLTLEDIAEHTGVSYNTAHRYLAGKRDPSKSFIDCMLDLTGMTYEEAFRPTLKG